MAVQELRIYLDGEPAAQAQLALFSEIKVDQAIGMATEAELHMLIRADGEGVWSGMQEEFAQPFSRVRIEVKIRDGDFVALIDGPVIAQDFELDATPNQSKMVLITQDDSVLLNRDEEVIVYEDKSEDEIVQEIFGKFGLSADADTVTMPAGGLERVIVQRGTAMQLLRQLGCAHGIFVYVEPGDIPGQSVGVFRSVVLDQPEWPELQMMGRHRNINNFQAHFDALRPLLARADTVNIPDVSHFSAVGQNVSFMGSLGDIDVHDMVEAGQVILARTREQPQDVFEAVSAAIDYSSWAYTANAEVAADSYPAVLMPHHTINVAGVGGYLSGRWLISQVSHTIDLKKSVRSYTQNFTLRRNARSNGNDGAVNSAEGVF
jgi:hypothetical protein